MTIVGVGITSDKEVIIGTMEEVDSMLITICDHISFIEVFIVNDARFAIEGLYNDLLTIRLEKHVRDERGIEKVYIITLEDSIVEEKAGEDEERVTDD